MTPCIRGVLDWFCSSVAQDETIYYIPHSSKEIVPFVSL